MAFSVTPSDLIQYLYCPRFIYFERLLKIPQHEDNFSKVLRGRHLHDDRLARNKGYLRKRLGVVNRYDDQYLTNSLLRGRVDEVLELEDGSMAPLDYKFARFEDRIYSTYRTQLYCYAWLIQEHYGRPVRKGFIVYTRSQNHVVTVAVLPEHIEWVREVAESIREILVKNSFPKATKVRRRCVNCTYRKLCVQ